MGIENDENTLQGIIFLHQDQSKLQAFQACQQAKYFTTEKDYNRRKQIKKSLSLSQLSRLSQL